MSRTPNVLDCREPLVRSMAKNQDFLTVVNALRSLQKRKGMAANQEKAFCPFWRAYIIGILLFKLFFSSRTAIAIKFIKKRQLFKI